MRGRGVGLLFGFGAAALVVAGVGWSTRPAEFAPVAKVDRAPFDRALVKRGKSLAAMGNCAVCHTREGGEPYAGGRPMPTPFGTIYTTNITPDPERGIGRWSEAAFRRAMREGIDRAGNHLYPAFPYDRFAKLTDEDIGAIYAYLMSEVAPSSYAPPPNELGFPWNVRRGLAVWKLMYFDKGVWQPDPAQGKEWNRGAYLVEGIGHCGSCHTPRNFFGAERRGDAAYGGAMVEGWYAPPLRANSASPIPWTQRALVNYLMDGWDRHHGVAAGSMIPVVNNLHDQAEDDVFAIAAYVLSLKGSPRSEQEQAAVTAKWTEFAERTEWGHSDNSPVPDDPRMQLGARVFERQCAECHRSGGRTVPLGLSSQLNYPHPDNAIRVTLYGIRPPAGALGRSMPARDAEISDEELVALMAFLRARFTLREPWAGVAERVRAIRGRTGS